VMRQCSRILPSDTRSTEMLLMLARSRNAKEFPLVRTFQRVASGHLVALGDHVLDNHPEIGHAAPKHGHNDPDPLRAFWLVGNAGAVVDVVGRQQLID
jgi:hypothetical protein